MISWIGWIATAAFAGSYLCKEPATLRRVQAGAAVLWIAYGVHIEAAPVIVANLIVAGAALYSSLRLPLASAAAPGRPPRRADGRSRSTLPPP